MHGDGFADGSLLFQYLLIEFKERYPGVGADKLSCVQARLIQLPLATLAANVGRSNRLIFEAIA
jgi:hypothetical protein